MICRVQDCLYTIIGDKNGLVKSRYDPDAERSCIDMQRIATI